MLKKVIGNKINSLLISETNLDDTFPLSQFMLEGFIHHTDVIEQSMVEA